MKPVRQDARRRHCPLIRITTQIKEKTGAQRHGSETANTKQQVIRQAVTSGTPQRTSGDLPEPRLNPSKLRLNDIVKQSN